MYGLYARFGQATHAACPASSSTAATTGCSTAPACATATCSAPTTASSATRRSARRLAFDDVEPAGRRRRPGVAARRLPDDVEIVALTPVSNLAMGEYPASIAALDDQGDLEFVAERIYGGGERALAKVRHGNAVMLTCRPFGSAAGKSSRSAAPTGCSASHTMQVCNGHEQRRHPGCPLTDVSHVNPTRYRVSA